MRIAAIAGSALLFGVVAANAADIAVKARPMPVAAQVFSWTGFYVGANVGGAWSPSSGSSDFGPVIPAFLVLPPVAAIPTLVPGGLGTLAGDGGRSGVIGGGQIGYNWQVNQFVLGVEADAVGSGLKGGSASASRTSGAPLFAPAVTQTVTVDFGQIDWMATFRGRAGVTVDRALFYVTGGAAVAEIGGSTTTVVHSPGIAVPAGTFTATNGGSTTRWGWTVGGGIEWAFNPNWSLAGEYRYTDFGSRSVAFTIPDGLGGVFATGTSSSHLTVQQATVRVNYRFGGPVVAKY
ncbi:outer membrane beta-barrel protein [Bradyrhizobium xenonodulans]|uniref:Outer membrane beta-barrel protein n=1 Tax=Bradyrhizobium xenonodulans TaxID=2736875 RepID=A0ABY7MQL1_9BRAD|nr:outer membrane beta-barrel protein [Bradyrhizobium xenonodulans]WBL80685.1 outer membrane beta-barrel protein [Bradyrhizobium xenonodulans]